MDIQETATSRSDTGGLQRSPDVWFEDGNVIVQAESTLFRIYKGILQARSSVFNDMFSFPQPSDQETIEGCPIVLVHDSAPDMAVFLKAIYDSGFYERSSQTSFSVTAGILRLSTKYDVAYLRHRAIHQLRDVHPTTLKEWDDRTHIPLISDVATSHFAIVNLARETDVLMILPAALYRCSMHSVSDIFNGLVQPDGSRTELSQTDKLLCLNARECFACHEPMLAFMGNPDYVADSLSTQWCESRVACSLEINVTKVLRAYAEAEKSIDLLDDSHYPIDVADVVEDLCKECAALFRRVFDSKREQVWHTLPGSFGLPPWHY
ncbi:hypothetical protein PLICRDRAFT_700276 [Plicaturopsis crispa FD-325 SS-3]|nr:hypothetical protein PLICRDRAFT_700276 [Plicaturopsis crispa FD-325 SS-3]